MLKIKYPFKKFYLYILVLFQIFNFAIVEAKKTIDFTAVLAPGYKLLTTGYSQEAAAAFAKKTKKYPDSAACHIALGKAYKVLGKISLAKNEFKTATFVQSNYAEGYLELAKLQESDQEWNLAIQSFQEYAKLDPDEANRQGINDRIKFCQEKSASR